MDTLMEAQATLLGLDSGARATSVSDLFTGVPGMHPLMVPWGSFVIVAIYLLGKPALAALVRATRFNARNPVFRLGVLLHNVALFAYSGWTAVNVVPLTINWVRHHGALDTYCSHGLWDAGLGYWSFLFYISKVWELFDTALLIAKQRKPSYLQVYHHAATLVCAYWLVASHASVNFLFVGLNATIHTVMYFYYALSSVGIRLPGKSLITSAQIAQFVGGIFLALPLFVLDEGRCATPASKFAVAGIILHAMYLTVLFSAFYSQTYSRKKV